METQQTNAQSNILANKERFKPIVDRKFKNEIVNYFLKNMDNYKNQEQYANEISVNFKTLNSWLRKNKEYRREHLRGRRKNKVKVKSIVKNVVKTNATIKKVPEIKESTILHTPTKQYRANKIEIALFLVVVCEKLVLFFR